MATAVVPANAPPVHLCGQKLENARHVCCFFNSREEEYAVLSPFVQEGLAQGEQVVNIVARSLQQDHDDRIKRAGVDVTPSREKGQYVVVTSEDAYLSDGTFDPTRTLKTLDTLIDERKRLGYPQLRITGNMEWALDGSPGTEKLLEYEVGVTRASQRTHDVFVCFYDIQQFDAPTLMDILRTHPAVVLGGSFHENPFFVPPERMIKDIRSRGPKRVTG